MLFAVCRFGFSLEVWFDGLVLFVKLSKIGNEVLDNVCVGKRINASFVFLVGRNTACKA